MKKIIIATLVFALLATVFAMSGDGVQQPVKQEKGTEAVYVKSEQVQPVDKSVQEPQYAQSTQPEVTGRDQEQKSGERVTVKDDFGIETGMTKEELEKFKEEYMQLHQKLIPWGRTTMLFDYKIDLTKYDDLKKLGVDLKNAGSFAESKTYKENSIYSHIIIIGRTVSMESNGMEDINTLEIEYVLKGEEILINKFGRIPKTLEYPSQPNVVGETQPVIGIKAIYFLAYPHPQSKMGKKYWIMRRPASTILSIENGRVAIKESLFNADTEFLEQYKEMAEEGKASSYILESFDEVIEKIVKIVEVNNPKAFYQIKFMDEEDK